MCGAPPWKAGVPGESRRDGARQCLTHAWASSPQAATSEVRSPVGADDETVRSSAARAVPEREHRTMPGDFGRCRCGRAAHGVSHAMRHQPLFRPFDHPGIDRRPAPRTARRLMLTGDLLLLFDQVGELLHAFVEAGHGNVVFKDEFAFW